jgi:hypothetical protein
MGDVPSAARTRSRARRRTRCDGLFRTVGLVAALSSASLPATAFGALTTEVSSVPRACGELETLGAVVNIFEGILDGENDAVVECNEEIERTANPEDAQFFRLQALMTIMWTTRRVFVPLVRVFIALIGETATYGCDDIVIPRIS